MTRGVLAVVCVAYLLTRVAMAALPPVNVHGYLESQADEWEKAGRDGAKFYATRAATGEGEARDVEYPPLLLWLVRVPYLVSRSSAGGAPFHVVYQRALILADAAALVLAVWLLARFYPDRVGRRAVVYLLCTLALFPVLLTTVDLVIGLVLLAALGVLLAGRHPLWSLAVLAVGVGLKVTPVAAAPVWLIGTLPADALRGTARGVGRLLVRRTALFAGLCGACFVPFVLFDGPGAVGFVRYHANRGMEYEAVVATALWAADPPLEEYGAYGCIEVRSPHSAAIVRVVPWVSVAALLAVTALFVRAVRRGDARAGGTLAASRPGLFTGFALLYVMTFVVTNKAFSPQYMLWVVPLAVLVPLAGWRYGVFAGGLFVACALTTLQGGLFAWPGDPLVPWRPHMLAARNVLFVGLTLFLAASLGRRAP